MTGHTARKNPCASCPYRRDVPSGVWAAEEYDKLPEYDNETSEQPLGIFHCHQQDGHICSGWLGTHGAQNLLSMRIGASMGYVDPSTFDYETDVPLFDSGAEAAQHGMSEIDSPSARAQRTIDKIKQVRSIRGN